MTEQGTFELSPEAISFLQAFINSGLPSVQWRTQNNEVVMVDKETAAHLVDRFLERNQALRLNHWERKALVDAAESIEQLEALTEQWNNPDFGG